MNANTAIATATAPAHVGSWLWLSRARAKQDDLVAARGAVDQAIALQPGWVSVELQHADVLAGEGRTADAVTVCPSPADRLPSALTLRA